MDERLTPFYHPALEFDVNIRHRPPFPHERDAVPFVGNGYFGVEVAQDAHLFIRGRRGLQIPLLFHPIVSLRVDDESEAAAQESTVTEYQTGLVHRFQCAGDRFFAAYQYYAHRNSPAILVQELKITSLRNQPLDVPLLRPRLSDWPTAVERQMKLQHGSTIQEYSVVSGSVEVPGTDQVRVVAVLYRDLPQTLSLKRRGTTSLELLTAVTFSEPVSRAEAQQAQLTVDVERRAIAAMEKALQDAVHERRDAYYEFRRQHMKVWASLWATGFSISTSLAEGALNGDRINATIYAVLSQVPALEFEDSITPQKSEEIRQALTYAEGCYDSYHTLEAANLWRALDSVAAMNEVVASWLLTLEKHGCEKLLRAGASGVVQAMVLSFGSFRFSDQHLELRIHPKYLHRNYAFRRLNYGDMTHVNVSIAVTEENKAVIFAALDRSDGHYYACDAGCLDEPAQLYESRRVFPVKLTDPLTPILYITSDKGHMEVSAGRFLWRCFILTMMILILVRPQELKHAIHVKEVIEGEFLLHILGVSLEGSCFMPSFSFQLLPMNIT